MGQFKFSMYFSFTFGLAFEYERESSFAIYLPGINIYIGLMEEARGVMLFEKWFW